MRPAGSPYAVFHRALKHGNLWVAEAEARDLRHVPLEDALKLVYLYADKESPKYERAAMKWLRRYLEDRNLSIGCARSPQGRMIVATNTMLVWNDTPTDVDARASRAA